MKTVAVIEDDVSMRTSVSRALRASGYACETYESAEEYLERASDSKADNLLIDIHLGGLSGIELCRRLTCSGRHFNIILMTGVSIDTNEKQAADAGCSACLQKPFSTRTLIDAIEGRQSA